MYNLDRKEGVFLFLTALILLCHTSTVAQNSVSITSVLLSPTFEHMGIHVDISGDVNQNSNLQIEYRPSSGGPWMPGGTTMRAHPQLVVDGSQQSRNFLAGSAMFLQPATSYNFRITLTDPDGGGTVLQRTKSTRGFPIPAPNGTVLHVVPGNGGGSGTQNNPYQGVQTAVNNAQPGNILELANGVYSPFVITTDGLPGQPIVIKSAELHGAIIDGANTNRSVVEVGNFSDSTQHIMIDGLTIRNGKWGVDAQNTQYLTIMNCDIYDVDWAVYNRRQNGWEHNQYLTNNRMVGRTSWPQTGIPGERGVDLRGNMNVVSYNTIKDFADGVTIDGITVKRSYAQDVHNNDISRIVDDLIEMDGTISNSRVYQNRCYNGRAGVSLAPIYGGPVYVFRNELYNIENSAYKMNRGAAGLVIVNNTSVKSNNGLSSPAGWQNTVVKNNAILSSGYCLQEYGLVNGSMDDWDNNGYKSLRSATSAGPWFKWDNIRYNDIASFKANTPQETNGFTIDQSDFLNVIIPSVYTTEIDPSTRDITPSSGSSLINAGLTSFPNIQLPFVQDGQPDVGAIEAGMPPPIYGHDWSMNEISLDICLWLEGPYDSQTGQMGTRLLQNNLLPSGQPYNTPHWNYPGTEGQGWTSSDYPVDAVDWVLVSLQTNTNKSSGIATTAAVLLRDGCLYFPDESVLPVDPGVPLYIVVRHRNHIAAMSATPISISGGALTYDFRLEDSYRGGAGLGQKQISNGVWALFAGDGDQLVDPIGYDINGQDKVLWSADNGMFLTYKETDFNLDGDINGMDRIVWSYNNGIFSDIEK